MSMDMLRGHRGIERHFGNEEEAVQYVYEQISDGKVSNSHLAAFTFDSAEIEYVEKELEEMFIPFTRNDVPYFSFDGKMSVESLCSGKI